MTSSKTATSLTFEAKGHVYRLNGEAIPSVTQVLSEVGIISDYMSQIAEEHRRRGNLVHQATAWADDPNEADADPDHLKELGILGYVESWAAVAGQFTFRHIEQRMAHPVLKYAGTPDRILLDGRPLDIKSGGPDCWHKVQLAGYSVLYGAQPKGKQAEGGIDVYLHRDGSPATIQSHNGNGFKTLQTVWKAALTTYNFKRGRLDV